MQWIGVETVLEVQESVLLFKGMSSFRLEGAQEGVHTEKEVRGSGGIGNQGRGLEEAQGCICNMLGSRLDEGREILI